MTTIEGMEETYKNYKEEYVGKTSNYMKPYSVRILSYAEDIADSLEKKIKDSNVTGNDAIQKFILENIAEVRNTCDYDGVTGFMDSSATKILQDYWVYGNFIN